MELYRGLPALAGFNCHKKAAHGTEKIFEYSRAFRRQSHLVVQEQRHTGDSVYKCSHCSKVFPQNMELRHEKIHSGQKPYECRLCYLG